MSTDARAPDPERTWMCGPASNAEAQPSEAARAEHLRDAIEREYATLCRRIGTLVYRICGRLRREEVAERVQEVLNETVQRALQGAGHFEMGRSATAWLIGIALRILQEQRRGRMGRSVVQSDLGDEAWRQALDELCTVAESDAATTRLDIRQALSRLDQPQRRAVELRYFEGLDGEELARALDAPTAGAARVRLARALQALRAQFGAAGDEGSP
jgi:RNA polymerase sigma factor (sigma-70 family)